MVRYSHSAKMLAIALAMLAGFIDAIGFLLTGGLFVSFMSGNSTRLAVGVATGSSVAGYAGLLIASFVAGVVLGSLAAARWPSRRMPIALALVSSLLAVAALLDMSGLHLVLLVPMAMAMGCANTVFQRDGDVTIGVTYMTGALVRLGQRLADALRGGNRWDWLAFLLLWSGLVSGAIAGALLFSVMGAQCLWIGVGVAILLGGWAVLLDLDQPQLREGR